MLRGRQLDERFLRHSDWVRRIGVASSAALASVISFPLLVFVVLPVALTQFSGPSSLLSLIATFLILYLSVCHTIELTSAVPKNCVLYHFSSGCLGELASFLVGCLLFLDALGVSSLLLSAWSSHMNILFRKGIRPSFSVEVLDRQDDSQILAADYDLFAALGIFFSLTILCCSVKVVSTLSICFLCVTLLVVASCTMVSFFHADPQNWIDAGFFKNGFSGLLRSAGILMVAFNGVDSATTMIEETQKPRKRVPVLMVFLTFVFTVVFFLIIMIFSLSVNVSNLPSNILMPDIFTTLNIPAANPSHEYGFRRIRSLARSNKLLLVFLFACFRSFCHKHHPKSQNTHRILFFLSSKGHPKLLRVIVLTACAKLFYQMNYNSRYMLTVASICGLSGAVLASFLPASRILEAMTRDGLLPFPKDSSKKSPIFAMIVLSLFLCLSLLIRRDLLLDIVCTTTPLKHVLGVCFTYLQHYLPEPLGLPQETSHYKTLNKRRVMGSCQVSASQSGQSMDSDAYCQMNIAAIETTRLQRRLEREQLRKYEEEEPVLSHSVSQYQSIPDRPSSGLSGLNHGHNCVAEACSPDDGAAHIYCREVPEIPYVYSFNGSLRTTSPSTMAAEFRKSCQILLLFILSTSLVCFLGVKNEHHSLPSVVLIVLFSAVSISSALMSFTVTPNDYLHHRENKVALFPFVSYFLLILLFLILSSSPCRAWITIIAWNAIVLGIYCGYGRWCSAHRGKRGTAAISAIADQQEEGEEYRAIMSGEECTEM